jgi:putative transposase
MVGQLVSFSIRGQIVARYLSGLIETRGKPERILCDNGTEFAIKAMFFLSKLTRARLSFIQPGKPKTPLWRV